MRALYLAIVVMMLIATAMNVEGNKGPSCSTYKGKCNPKGCGKDYTSYSTHDCKYCCVSRYYYKG